MNELDFDEIVAHFADFNDRLLIVTAFRIAAEQSFNEEIIKKYGTIVCEQFQNLQESINTIATR